MEKQIEPKEVWRIGSECGPKLELVSLEMWEKTAKPLNTSIDHLRTLERLAQWERKFSAFHPPHYQLGWADQQRAIIAAGELTPHERRVLGSHISSNARGYKVALLRQGAQTTLSHDDDGDDDEEKLDDDDEKSQCDFCRQPAMTDLMTSIGGTESGDRPAPLACRKCLKKIDEEARAELAEMT